MHTRPSGVVCVTTLQARSSLHHWCGPAEVQDVEVIPEEARKTPWDSGRGEDKLGDGRNVGSGQMGDPLRERRTRLGDAGVVRRWIYRQQEKGRNLGNGKAPARWWLVRQPANRKP